MYVRRLSCPLAFALDCARKISEKSDDWQFFRYYALHGDFYLGSHISRLVGQEALRDAVIGVIEEELARFMRQVII